MSMDTMKIEVESESCCVCGVSGEELWTPEEHDAGAAAHLPPLRAVLLHLNHAKTVASGRLCTRCIQKAQDAYAFSCSLAARGPPPLADKIRALRSRLAELTAKIDVFIVVGGGANGAYSEEDIIMVEKAAVAAAAASDAARPPPAASLAGEPCYQCTVCPQTFQAWAEYNSHVEGHAAGAVHSCWTCGAQFQSRAAAEQHAAEHATPPPTSCPACHLNFQSAEEARAHEAVCTTCPACGALAGSRAELRAHAAGAHGAACSACARVFPSRAARLAHAAQHAPRHLLCGYDGCILRFTTRASLMSHLRKCHGGGAPARAPSPPAPPALVACNACPRQFGSLAAMKRHARVHRTHPQEGEVEVDGEGQVEAEGRVEYLEVETLEDVAEEVLS